MSGRPVPSQLDQVLPQFYVQKAGPYHPFGRIRIAPFGKGGLRILAESGYIQLSNDATAKFAVHVRMKNFGQTPAYKFSTWLMYTIDSADSKPYGAQGVAYPVDLRFVYI